MPICRGGGGEKEEDEVAHEPEGEVGRACLLAELPVAKVLDEEAFDAEEGAGVFPEGAVEFIPAQDVDGEEVPQDEGGEAPPGVVEGFFP